jgi:hypothetical protein
MPAVIVDPKHARSLGWDPRYSFSEGVAGVWEEWRAADIEGAVPLAGGAGLQAPAGERS